MRLIFLLSLLLLQPSFSSYGQTAEPAQSQTDAALQKVSLLADLQALEATAAQLDKPLARAAAAAEIADAAWTLDTDWAKRLLQGAYELTFPSEEVQAVLDLANKVDAKEAVALAKKGVTAGAQALAARLTKAIYILQAHPAIVEKCLANKDRPCAESVVSQAIRQLRQAATTPPVLPPGVPASALAGGEEFDPVLSGLSKLALLILPADPSLASEALSEMVAAANVSKLDTGLGRAGFDAEVFQKIARKDEMHARQSAMSLKDTLRQVVSLAAVYRWKAEELGAKAKAAPPNKAKADATKPAAPATAQ